MADDAFQPIFFYHRGSSLANWGLSAGFKWKFDSWLIYFFWICYLVCCSFPKAASTFSQGRVICNFRRVYLLTDIPEQIHTTHTSIIVRSRSFACAYSKSFEPKLKSSGLAVKKVSLLAAIDWLFIDSKKERFSRQIFFNCSLHWYSIFTAVNYSIVCDSKTQYNVVTWAGTIVIVLALIPATLFDHTVVCLEETATGCHSNWLAMNTQIGWKREGFCCWEHMSVLFVFSRSLSSQSSIRTMIPKRWSYTGVGLSPTLSIV